MSRQTQRVDFKVRVFAVPADLQLPVKPGYDYLCDASVVYRLAMESRLLWDVWMIDEYGELWIAVSFENDRDQPEFHTLRLDRDTYRKVPCDPYEVLSSQPFEP